VTVALRGTRGPHLGEASSIRHDTVIKRIDDDAPLDRYASPVEVRMAGKILSVEPTVDPSAKLHDARLGAYCEVGARTILHDVVMDDYSYVVNDAQITYATIGRFCSIAAMTNQPRKSSYAAGLAGALHLSRQRLFPGRERRA
jgi:carbonic anhydrase/acetyltransferase-like protein (isoleucine patch superfamily)